MTDKTPGPGEIKRAFRGVEVRWDAARTSAAWAGLVVRRKRRARRRAVGGVLAVAALVLGGAALWQEDAQHAAHAPPAVAEAPRPPRLAPLDPAAIELGDVVVVPEADAQVAIEDDAPDHLAVRIVRGKSRIRVPAHADEAPRLAVAAGTVRLQVWASEFSVARHDHSTELWVHRGEVVVLREGERQVAPAGAYLRFEVPRERRRGSHERGSDWQRLALRGSFDAAYDRLAAGAEVGRDPDALMLAADVYRMTGHPREAVRALEAVAERRSDSRAPLAAFTLGRILLDELGRPRAAARAFRKARDHAPAGPLAEDALAREVEAWARAGDTERARARARLYLETYPHGHRTRAVKQYAEL